jgi:hypothetical protein
MNPNQQLPNITLTQIPNSQQQFGSSNSFFAGGNSNGVFGAGRSAMMPSTPWPMNPNSPNNSISALSPLSMNNASMNPLVANSLLSSNILSQNRFPSQQPANYASSYPLKAANTGAEMIYSDYTYA